MKLIKFYFKKDVSSDFYYFVEDYQKNLIMESIFIFVISFIMFVVTGFNLIFIFGPAFGIFNLVNVFTSISKAKFEINKMSPEYQIEMSIYEVFFKIKILTIKMFESGISKNEISNFRKSILERIKTEKTLISISVANKEINLKSKELYGFELDFDKKEMSQFLKKEVFKWAHMYYPNLKTDLANKHFSKEGIKPKNEKNQEVQSTNHNIDKYLIVMGLPTTTRDFAIIKKRYYELIKTFHPDSKNSNDLSVEELQERTIEINMAFNEIKKMLGR